MNSRMIQKLQCIIRELNLQEYKVELYSGYGVSSSKDMTRGQLIDLIGRLEKQKAEQNTERKKLISNCLSIITNDRWMGFPNSWDAINRLVEGKGIGRGKLLYQMNNEELRQCHKRLVMAHTNGLRYHNRNDKVKKMEAVDVPVNVVVVPRINNQNILN